MKSLFLKLTFMIVILFAARSIEAQTYQIPRDSLELKAKQYLQEVYMECPQYINEQSIAMGVDFLSRLVIHSVSENQYPECRLLSSVYLKNKCNPQIIYDVDRFNLYTFNPLKYLFSFKSTSVAYYRVDGTNYIIEIKPILKS